MPVVSSVDAERFDHRPLAFGRAAVVGAHGGEQERAGTVVAEPVAGGAEDGGNVADAAAAGGDGHFAARDGEAERIELSLDGGADVGEGVRDKSLADAEKIHCRFSCSENPEYRAHSQPNQKAFESTTLPRSRAVNPSIRKWVR